jgi:Asp-tRNA(Asn)/Glu-tRNA(Gln) amidotransferase A subunit family amidase
MGRRVIDPEGGVMETTELCWKPARELARLIRAQEVSPVEVVEAFLARIERINPQINAYCTVTADQARAAAREAEAAIQAGERLGPLHGVPFSLKDLTPTRGIRTTMGSKIFEDNIPTEDAILVERLRGAGAILLGKTNTPEFGCKPFTDNRLFGATANPWSLERSAGGSSGGAAAAVAAGQRGAISRARSATRQPGAESSGSNLRRAGSPGTQP